MNSSQLTTPIAFIIFNRPDTTQLVFNEISKAKPSKLLIIGDGARAGEVGELEKVNACRDIIKQVNWNCEILTNFSDVNLGCKDRLSSGLDWVFSEVEEAIILEDDCLPHSTFFRFCEELLIKYRDDDRISLISGDNFQFGQKYGEASYYFSRFGHIWGWASWRRSWKCFDKDIKIWPKVRDEGWLGALSLGTQGQKYWTRIFQSVYDRKIDTCWDYQWLLSSWAHGRLAILPQVNLVSNIGFGPEATHTFSSSPYSNIATESMDFPLAHPDIFLPCIKADAVTADAVFSDPSLIRRVIRKVKSLVG